MTTLTDTRPGLAADDGQPEYEAIIIGAGVCGIYQMYRLQEMGVRATVLEAGPDVGGRPRYREQLQNEVETGDAGFDLD